MTDNDIYKNIAAELSSNATDTAIWTKAFAESDGDLDKARARYIRLRYLALKKLTEPLSSSFQSERQVEDDIVVIRDKLQSKLNDTKRSSLYGVLQILPSCNDSEVADLIQAMVADSAKSHIGMSADVRYAIEILGSPVDREQYDLSMWKQLSGDAATSRNSVKYNHDAENKKGIFEYWWGSRKVSVIIGVMSFFAIGYMFTNFVAMKGKNDVEKKHAENERVAVDGQIGVLKSTIDHAAELENRSLGIQEEEERRRRTELEYRANAGSQLLEMQRREQEQRMEMQRVEQERRMEMQREALRLSSQREEEWKSARLRQYWACMNTALDHMNNARAEVACSSYR